jgi:hypothetical protein
MRVHGMDRSESPGVRGEPPAASASLLRTLQGSAGNRAVARLLRTRPELVGRPRLLRLPIELENLTEEARKPGRGKGGLIEGSKVPHMVHNYWLPSEAGGGLLAHAYNPDTWVNGPVQTPGAQNVPAADELRVAIMATVRRREIQAAIQQWQCADSIFKGLVQYFVLGAPEPKWYAPGEGGNAHVGLEARDTMVTTPDRRRLTMHLLTMRAVAHWRVNSMHVLNREEIILKPTIAKVAKTDIKVNPKWDTVIRTLRGRVKTLLTEEIANPGSRVPPVVALRSVLDNDIVDTLTADQELGKVIGRGHITMGQKDADKWEFISTRTNGVETTTIDQASLKGLKEALRHLRFLIYVEWRAAYELLANSRRFM